MLPTLYLSLRPNNQVTIGRQNCIASKEDVYQGNNAFFLSASNLAVRSQVRNTLESKVESYKKFGSKSRTEMKIRERINKDLPFKYVPKISPLDIILKSQRSLQSFSTAGFVFAFTDAVVKYLRYYGGVSMSEPKKFTYKSGQKIRECGAVVDMLCDGNPSNARVVTLTLPASTSESYEVLAAYSGYAVNRLFQKVRRDVPDCNNWFFVWEHQKRGALHLHICIYHSDKNVSRTLGDNLVDLWIEILRDITIQSGVNMFWNPVRNCEVNPINYQNKNQEMRKSCGGYFSKYASKSSRNEENSYVHEMAQKYPPSRFWGSSKSIKKMINEHSFTYSKTFKNEQDSENEYEYLLNILLEMNIVQYSEYSFMKEIDIKMNNGEVSKLKVSEGFRQTFYLSQSDYAFILDKMKWNLVAF